MAIMWERLLTEQTTRVEALEVERRALQARLDLLVSPHENLGALATFKELGSVNRLLEDARSRLTAIVGQNALQDQKEARFYRRPPLQQNRQRDGFYRSEQDRTAAILGILERERRQNATLSRDEFDRLAKSTDAKSRRSMFPRVTSVTPETWQYPQVDGITYDPGTGELYPWLDPCVEYRTLQKMRRRVMFAQRSAGRGYRGPRVRSPC